MVAPAHGVGRGGDGLGRAGVEEAELWGDQVLQPLARRLVWASLKRDPGAMLSYSEGADIQSDLNSLISGTSLATSAATLRNSTNADIVTLLTYRAVKQYFGIGRLLTSTSSQALRSTTSTSGSSACRRPA